jgi:hypothetical protein
VALEHDAAAAEGVGDQAVGAGFDVAALNRQHPIRMIDVPRFTAAPRLEARVLELCPHGAVGEQGAQGQGLENGASGHDVGLLGSDRRVILSPCHERKLASSGAKGRQ